MEECKLFFILINILIINLFLKIFKEHIKSARPNTLLYFDNQIFISYFVGAKNGGDCGFGMFLKIEIDHYIHLWMGVGTCFNKKASNSLPFKGFLVFWVLFFLI